MRTVSGFQGLRHMERHQRMSAVLGGLCIFAMAIGVTPGLSAGQVFGAIVAILAFGSILTLAVGSKVGRAAGPIAGRIAPEATSVSDGVRVANGRSGRRAA
ncbi:MAG: hypothetical protein KF912_05635 [Phycisphaeraceae bacterium]|nr:hypothetical protein [Phycisphaeraceae bacterium]MBX3366780.1 hypothetical protein [Phycisphaeraceae bacterium]